MSRSVKLTGGAVCRALALLCKAREFDKKTKTELSRKLRF
jgi:hypothetical protein